MDAHLIDYDTVMANLEKLKAAATAEYEKKMAGYDSAKVAMDELFKTAPNGATKPANDSKELPSNAFANMTIFESAKSYLEFCKKPQTSDEIAKALKKHGIQSSSKDFSNTLRTILYKRKNSKDVVRVGGRKWKLNPHK